jgi:hypothetical protein
MPCSVHALQLLLKSLLFASKLSPRESTPELTLANDCDRGPNSSIAMDVADALNSAP